MPNLYIIGDSFSFPHQSINDLWPIVASKFLAQKINLPVYVKNQSFIGCSQDYIWKKFMEIEKDITADDFLVIVLTSADRFWIKEDKPEWSNIQTIDNAAQMTNDPGFQQIILGFMSRIWRTSLSSQHQSHRLGYLGYTKLKKNLRKPIVLKAFDSVNVDETKFTDIIFSKGHLSEIQLHEWELYKQNKPRMDPLLESTYWCHVDCRYNHLTLSNHRILGRMIGDSLFNGTNPDLSPNNFEQKIITVANHKDESFAKLELNTKWFKEMINNSLRTKFAANKLPLFF